MLKGKLVDKPNFNNNNNKLWDTHTFNEEWYYEKVQNFIRKNNNYNNNHNNSNNNNKVYLTIDDFLFRYDRGAFWMAKPVTITITTKTL